MTFTFRPAKREHTPLIIGLAGPTKSGKTYSAHRLAVGLANGGPVVMINAEGAKGHQYADEFTYTAADITAPYRPERYTEVLKAAFALDPKPAVVIIDSGSHMHDGPGGILEYHEDELDRLAGQDYAKRQRSTYSAWIKPKAAENEFIYTMLGADCHIILCLRAKEKIKVVTGKPPIDLGWQPIVGERVAFETIFTLVLPPHSKGVPDLAVSEMRKPFDAMIPPGQQLSEDTGRLLAQWAAGADNDPLIVREKGRPGSGSGNLAGGIEAAAAASPVVPGPDTESVGVREGGSASDGVDPAAPTDEPLATAAQKKKLDVLVGQLRDTAGLISTPQLWRSTHREPVASEDGEFHWAPLRELLSKDEAHALITRLQTFADNLADVVA
jgi:hypothetical protein